MNWKERAKSLGDWSERERSAEQARRAVEKEEAARSIEERKQAISAYMPRVREVCEEFACEIGVEAQVHMETAFPYVSICAPMIEPLIKGSIKVTVTGGPIRDPSSRILVTTACCTDWLFEKCRDKDSQKTLRGYCLHGWRTTGYIPVSEASYVIPLCDFTEDELAAVLEEFCRHGMIRGANR